MAGLTGILSAISAVFGFLRKLAELVGFAQAKQSGRDEVIADQARQKDERLKDAMEAEIEADKAHKTIPGDEAFDNEFRRD